MKTRAIFSVLTLFSLVLAGGMIVSGQDSATHDQKSAHKVHRADDAERTEGQKRFEQNCGRCHHAPESLSPRVTPTVLMHMRVRANLTAEDQRLILKFMAR